MLKYKSMWREDPMDAKLVVDFYLHGGGLYIGLWCDSEGYFEPYCDITKNLPNEELSDENCAFVDVNNCPNIWQFIEENGLAEPTGLFGFSGMCCYPEYRFNLDAVEDNVLEEMV